MKLSPYVEKFESEFSKLDFGLSKKMIVRYDVSKNLMYQDGCLFTWMNSYENKREIQKQFSDYLKSKSIIVESLNEIKVHNPKTVPDEIVVRFPIHSYNQKRVAFDLYSVSINFQTKGGKLRGSLEMTNHPETLKVSIGTPKYDPSVNRQHGFNELVDLLSKVSGKPLTRVSW